MKHKKNFIKDNYFLIALFSALILFGAFFFTSDVLAETIPIKIQDDSSATQGNVFNDSTSYYRGTFQFIGSGFEFQNGDTFTLDIGLDNNSMTTHDRYSISIVSESNIKTSAEGYYYVDPSSGNFNNIDSVDPDTSAVSDLGGGLRRITFDMDSVSTSDILVVGMHCDGGDTSCRIRGSTSTPATGLGEYDNSFINYRNGSNDIDTFGGFYSYLVVGDILNISNLSIDSPSDSVIFSDFLNYSVSFDKPVGDDGVVYPIYKLRDITEARDIPFQAGNSAYISTSTSGHTFVDEKEASLDTGHSYSLEVEIWQSITNDDDILLDSTTHDFTITDEPDQTNFINAYSPVNVSVEDVANWQVLYNSEDDGIIEVFASTTTDVYNATSTFSGYDLAGVRSVDGGSSGLLSIPVIVSLDETDDWHWRANLIDSNGDIVNFATSTFDTFGDEVSSGITPPSGGTLYNNFKTAVGDSFPFDFLIKVRDTLNTQTGVSNQPIEVSFTDNPAFGTTTYTLLDESTMKDNLGGEDNYNTFRDYIAYFFYFILASAMIVFIYNFTVFITTSDQ